MLPREADLAGRIVTLAYSLLDGTAWIEHEGRTLELHEVDPVANARRKRLPRRSGQQGNGTSVGFDPAQVLLDKATGRRRKEDHK